MQLLTQTTATDAAAFKTSFDADTENRMNAGLTLLQMWHDADDAATVLCLYKVNDRDRAAAWLDRQSGVSGRWLRTA